ncbi:hypothetical protein ACQ4PT_020092 [Festuca glaucescens]
MSPLSAPPPGCKPTVEHRRGDASPLSSVVAVLQTCQRRRRIRAADLPPCAAGGDARRGGSAARRSRRVASEVLRWVRHGRRSSPTDTTNLSHLNIVQSNCGSSSIDGVIDWSQIEIAPTNENEIEVPIAEENLCLMLGINDKSGHRLAMAGAAIEDSIANINASMDDIDADLLADAAFPVPNHMPEETHFWYDKEHPMIEEGSMFSSMEEFRMLLRTFAIRGKFDIQIQDSDTTRFIGHCKGKICHWRITARTIEDGKTVRVNKIVKPHNCSSTAEVISSMVDQAWVVEKSIGILRTEPNIGASELQKRKKRAKKVNIGEDELLREVIDQEETCYGGGWRWYITATCDNYFISSET